MAAGEQTSMLNLDIELQIPQARVEMSKAREERIGHPRLQQVVRFTQMGGRDVDILPSVVRGRAATAKVQPLML
jgi:hypothetical protein